MTDSLLLSLKKKLCDPPTKKRHSTHGSWDQIYPLLNFAQLTRHSNLELVWDQYKTRKVKYPPAFIIPLSFWRSQWFWQECSRFLGYRWSLVWINSVTFEERPGNAVPFMETLKVRECIVLIEVLLVRAIQLIWNMTRNASEKERWNAGPSWTAWHVQVMGFF